MEQPEEGGQSRSKQRASTVIGFWEGDKQDTLGEGSGLLNLRRGLTLVMMRDTGGEAGKGAC